MADRPTVTTLTSGAKYDTDTLNTNFTNLRDAFDEIIGRSGTAEDNNSMKGDLDMQNHVLRNVTFETTPVGTDVSGNVATAEDSTESRQLDVRFGEWVNVADHGAVARARHGDAARIDLRVLQIGIQIGRDRIDRQ